MLHLQECKLLILGSECLIAKESKSKEGKNKQRSFLQVYKSLAGVT
jgi:hypothetical protein